MQLITKYRPSKWDEVLGQGKTTDSIQAVLEKGSAKAFILTGPSGVGKTTIARLIAGQLGVKLDDSGFSELDAATRTGVDDMREIKKMLSLKPIGGNGRRVICVDEAHMLSKSAWNALLKDVEEPPEGVYWVFCTTEASKIPDAIRTRCTEYTLKEVAEKHLAKLLEHVEKEEGFKLSEDVYSLVLGAAQGSPRRLLSALTKVIDVKDSEEAARILETYTDEGEKDVRDFCLALGKGYQLECLDALSKIPNATAEGIRAVVCAWYTKVALNPKTQRTSRNNAVAIVEAFGTPYPAGIGNSLYPVLVSLGKLELEG